MDILRHMDKFLEAYNVQKLNQGEIENMNRPITINEIESVIIIITIKTHKIQKSRNTWLYR